ncbi:hypothetical protein BMF94_4393 [Rhodotorula taiwanensis]|uniref:Uncharacterized protein n=1 Tax=Rhodotorula taiwanensis TaxID=741276 RepID=A0A2S5B723_9BASI|nr:hypothetical protein BMF94_4393 [Rhodotorula taiwanensis]
MGRNPFRTRPGGLSGPQPTHSSLGKAPGSKWGTKRAKPGQPIRRDGVFPDSDAEGAHRLASDQDSDFDSEQEPLATKSSSTKRRSAKSTAAKAVHAYSAETRTTSLSRSSRRRSVHAQSDSQDEEGDGDAALGADDVSDHDSDTTVGADSDDPDRPSYSRKKRMRAQNPTYKQARDARTAQRTPAAEDDEQERMRRIRAEAVARRLGLAGEGAGPVKSEKKQVALVIDDSSSEEDRGPPVASTSQVRLDSSPGSSRPVLSPVELRRTDQPRFMTLTALRTASKKKGSKAGARKKPKKGDAFYGSGNLLVSEDEIQADDVERDLEEYLSRKKRKVVKGAKADKGKGRAGDDALFRDDSSAGEGSDDDQDAVVARQLGAKKRDASSAGTNSSRSRGLKKNASASILSNEEEDDDDDDGGPPATKSSYSHLKIPKFVDPRADLARRKRLAELSSPPTSDFSSDDGGVDDGDRPGLNADVLEKERLELKRLKKVEREMKRKKQRYREERRPGYSNPRRN